MRPKLNLKSKSQMPLSHKHVGSKILPKIKMYTLTRAKLLFTLCYEIPCMLGLKLLSSIHADNWSLIKVAKKVCTFKI